MSLASLFGGIALANAKLGAVHGFAGPIGGMFSAPHGAVCAALLPYVFEVNQRVVARGGFSGTVDRFNRIAAVLTGDASATAEDAVNWLMRLVQDLGIPPLSSYGVRAADIPEIVRKAVVASSMKANPVVLSGEEMSGILERAI